MTFQPSNFNFQMSNVLIKILSFGASVMFSFDFLSGVEP